MLFRSVLVERFVRLIVESKSTQIAENQRAGVENILVITFTEKATKEVKQRIVDALNQRGLIEERRQLETAYISTIHGFCSRLLQENPFEAGVDPTFQVLDSPQSRRLFRQTFERVLSHAYYEQDQEILDLLAVAQRRREPGEDPTEPIMPLLTSLEGVLDRLRGAGRTLEEVSQHWLQGEDHTAQASEKVVGDWLAVLLLEIRVAYDALTTLQGKIGRAHV